MFELPAAKMDGFFKEADKNQDQHADQGEYMDFRSYIHNVGSWGCVLTKPSYDNMQANVLSQYSENEVCKKNTDEASCSGQCQWRGTPPPPPACSTYETNIDQCPTDRCERTGTACIEKKTDHCSAITDQAQCSPDNMCKFENNVCSLMTIPEKISHDW